MLLKIGRRRENLPADPTSIAVQKAREYPVGVKLMGIEIDKMTDTQLARALTDAQEKKGVEISAKPQS